MDDWFKTKPDPTGDVDDECLPEQAEALRAYLQGRRTASEAAKTLTRPTVFSSNPKDEVSRLYVFLLDALVELPSEHIHDLLDLVQAIEDLPEPNFHAMEDAQRPDEKLWRGLPGFATLWSDVNYQSGSWKMEAAAATGDKRIQLREAHLRKANVEAQLVSRSLAGLPIDWGYEAVDNALGSDESLLDFEVPAAAVWLDECGHRFQQGVESNEKSYVFRGGMNGKQWEAWKTRLEELRQGEGIVGQAAIKALDAIQKAANRDI